MNASGSGELYFLLDRGGSLVVFQETESAWVGVLAFTSEQKARDFIATSHLEAAEIAAIDRGDAEAVVALVTNVKRRAVRYVLLDLDYRTGRCVQIDFEGDRFGQERERQLAPRPAH